MSDDEWVKQALTDSTLAAKVLLNLFRSEPPPLRSGSATSQTLQLEWSVRQRRSKQSPKRKDEPTHASPNTPLSWSGGVSVSGSGSHDGSEETSRPPLKPVDNTRSKVATTNEITPPKRSRRKKTLAELKEELSSHLKENERMKNELEVVKLKFKNIRTENETLSRKLESEKEVIRESSKRIKFDYQSHSLPATTTAIELNDAISEVPLQAEAARHTSMMRKENEPHKRNGCSKAQGTAMASYNQTSFTLPDLNLPVDDGSVFEAC